MNFFTNISLPEAAFAFSYDDRIMMLGSCFAESIGTRMEKYKFDINVNPFGTLYNPFSISEALKLLLEPRDFIHADLFEREGAWHSFRHHGSFSSTDAEATLCRMNNRMHFASWQLKSATRMVVTFGSAQVYRLKETGKVVANCHKMPENIFLRERVSVESIVTEWGELINTLAKKVPEIKILFTVSPIRHWRDGAHENQRSKATLLLAVDKLCRRFPEQTDYFPAYEIMMDELRDYRFYASDMIHPSDMAIDYIWERFGENSLTHETHAVMRGWKDILNAIHHLPFRPNSEAYHDFIKQTMMKLEAIGEKFPSFDITVEKEMLRAKLLKR